MAVDLPLLTAVQAWRFAGFGFLALFVYGVLPGIFAWPAGLGDMMIGLTAPWVALALARRPAFAASPLASGGSVSARGLLGRAGAVLPGALPGLDEPGAVAARRVCWAARPGPPGAWRLARAVLGR
jgi:hypothetical protein